MEWTSKDSNVISVEGDGTTCTLTAESLGRATIVATVDGDGNEKESVEAAATAFDFDEAEGETERLANDASERD